MANSITGVNPLVFDTVGATSAITAPGRISSIIWDSGTSGAVGDVVLLNDASGGNIVFQATLAVAKDVIIWTPADPVPFSGLYLTTLGHGKLLVYLK